MFDKIKTYLPNFINQRTKPNKYIHYMNCAKIAKELPALKSMYDVRFSLMVQEMLRSEDSVSKEGMAEVARFMSSLIKEVEVGNRMYLQKTDEIGKWCMENNVKFKL